MAIALYSAMQSQTDLGDRFGQMLPEGDRSSLPCRRAQHLAPCSRPCGPCPFPAHHLRCRDSCPCPDPLPAHQISLSDCHPSLAHSLHQQKDTFRPCTNSLCGTIGDMKHAHAAKEAMLPRRPCCQGGHLA